MLNAQQHDRRARRLVRVNVQLLVLGAAQADPIGTVDLDELATLHEARVTHFLTGRCRLC